MVQHIHIVCLDVPWPADYGGAIDMMNRITAIHQLGIKIHLHYFSYNERGTPNELNRYCEKIYIYERKKPGLMLPMKEPYIISSRTNEDLLKNLSADNYPVLLEGMHCTGFLNELAAQPRKIVVRMHNEESVYYNELSKTTINPLKKVFFKNESRLLKKQYQQLPQNCVYACISEKDTQELKDKYQLQQVYTLPAFPSWDKVNSEEGLGYYCLFHGNLSVPENEKAAMWLLSNVFPKIKPHLIIAGKKPSHRLQKMAELCQHTCLVANPTEAEMNDLVQKAQINVLPCFNKDITGLRLKLLHALYEGRHCVVNPTMIKGSGLENACHIGTTADAFAAIITQLYHQPFCEEEIRLRKNLLENTYNNTQNAQKLLGWLA